MSDVKAVAADRTATTHGSSERMVMAADYEEKGVVGEDAMAEFFGVNDFEAQSVPGGDDGDDLILPFEVKPGDIRHFKLDSKCAERPGHLWVDEGKVKADIYVLVKYHPETRKGTCLRWEWGSVVRRAPVVTTPYHTKKRQHEIAFRDLRPMSELLARYRGKK